MCFEEMIFVKVLKASESFLLYPAKCLLFYDKILRNFNGYFVKYNYVYDSETAC